VVATTRCVLILFFSNDKSDKKTSNMRRNIRDVMDETQLDEATLAAQRQEMERLRRVQEQQRLIREVRSPSVEGYEIGSRNFAPTHFLLSFHAIFLSDSHAYISVLTRCFAHQF